MKKLNTSRKIFDKHGNQFTIIKRYPGTGNIALEKPGFDRIFTVDEYGYMVGTRNSDVLKPKQIAFNEEPETVEYLSLYPNGNVYNKNCCPVTRSSYDIENELIQIKVTKRGGKIIRKEFC